MKLTIREAILFMVTAAVGLFAVTAMLAGPKIREWKKTRSEISSVRRRIESYNRLLGQKKRWETRFEKLRGKLPSFSPGKDMNIHWLSTMDRIARMNGVKIIKRDAREEKKVGDVYELPIECRDWQGSLQALKDFLVEIESQGAMMDVRQMLVKPKSHNVLRGRFTLYCAYTRSENN